MLSRGAGRLTSFASRNSLIILMIVLAFAAVSYTVFDLCFAPAYPIGDWLINYSQGFVRRGLTGQFILLVGHALHMPLPWTAVIFQISIYLAFLYGVYRLAAPLRRDVLWYGLLFSPATLPFMILDAGNAFRKELLLFAALTAFIFLVRRGTQPLLLSLALVALFTIMVLSHDALFCCFLYFVAAVAVGAGDIKFAAKISAVPLVLAVLLIGLVSRYPGNEAMAMGICRSIGGKWITIDDTRDICSGAIKHLSWTVAHSRHEELQSLHYWPLYAFLAILSFAPLIAALVVLYRRDGLRFEVKVIASTAVLCALASAPLFYLTIDWGRWIHMQALCLLLLILMAAQRARGFQSDPNVKGIGEGRPWRGPLLVAVFLYCTCWTLPVYGGLPVRYGYIDVVRFFRGENRLLRRIDGWHTIDRAW